jgi:hypothetical protein
VVNSVAVRGGLPSPAEKSPLEINVEEEVVIVLGQLLGRLAAIEVGDANFAFEVVAFITAG